MVDIAIIGGGPAGLSAGLYAARGSASTVLFEELFAGGQAATTDRIDNYPGFPEGIAGAELGTLIEQQAKRFGLETRNGQVKSLELHGDVKRIHLAKDVVEARAVILAMGAKPKKLGLEREEALIGGGISYCATCDGAFFRNRDVTVVGGGDTALADALYLARFASKVYLVHRRDELRGSKALQKAVLAEPKIEPVWCSIITALYGEHALERLQTEHVETKEARAIDTAALFIAVGVEPRTALVAQSVALNENGHIKTDTLMRTNIPGVYAVGDVRDTPLRQVITAAADGAVAATKALEMLPAL